METEYEKALKAIKNLYSDTSQSKQETLEDLNGLRDEIDILIDSLSEYS